MDNSMISDIEAIDEKYFLKAESEFEIHDRDKALYAKIIALSEGDAEKAKYKYISLRAEQIFVESHDFEIKYMTVEEYAILKGISCKLVRQKLGNYELKGTDRDGIKYVQRPDFSENIKRKEEGEYSESPDDDTKNTHKPIEYDSKNPETPSNSLIINEKLLKQHYAKLTIEESGFISNLSNGNYSLARTYWLHIVFVGFITLILSKFIVSPFWLWVLFLSFTVHQMAALLGLWRSSSYYDGLKVWSILAKLVTLVGWVSLIGTWGVLILDTKF